MTDEKIALDEEISTLKNQNTTSQSAIKKMDSEFSGIYKIKKAKLIF